MTFCTNFVRTLVFVTLSVAFAQASQPWIENHQHFGPNLRNQLFVNAPVQWGGWVPQTDAGFDFSWIEPLGIAHYGDETADTSRYLRLQGLLTMSPYYAELESALGISPFNANPRVEFRFVYGNLIYLGSNVEMAMRGRTQESSVADTWNASHIYGSMYDNWSLEQIQSFGFWMDLDFSLESAELSGSLRYSLLDVRTDFSGKSFDYSRGLPVYSRDFVFEAHGHLAVPVSSFWDWKCQSSYYSTGYLRDPSGSYAKEPLGYLKVTSGAVRHWNNKHSAFSMEGGFWMRTTEDSFKGALAEQFLVQLRYQQDWSFNFAR